MIGASGQVGRNLVGALRASGQDAYGTSWRHPLPGLLTHNNIVHFEIETAGTFDLVAELKIWLSGHQASIQKKFNKRLNVYDVQRVLAHYVLH